MAEKQETGLQIKARTMQNFLMGRKGAFEVLIAKHMTPEKLVKGVLAAATRNPSLLDCTPISMMNACIVSGELGLDIGRPRGGMHLVPFRNGKTGAYEVTPIPDYRGLMDLAYRSGRVLSIEADAVCENDNFDYQRGTESYLRHKPVDGDRGQVKGFYAVAHIKEGRPVFEYLGVADVNKYRDRSKAWQSAVKNNKTDTPWHTDYEAMGKKTVVRRLANWLPQNPEIDLFQRAVELEGRMDSGEGISDLFNVIEVDGEAIVDEKGSRSGAMKDKLKGDEDASTKADTSDSAGNQGLGEPRGDPEPKKSGRKATTKAGGESEPVQEELGGTAEESLAQYCMAKLRIAANTRPTKLESEWGWVKDTHLADLSEQEQDRIEATYNELRQSQE